LIAVKLKLENILIEEIINKLLKNYNKNLVFPNSLEYN